MDPLDFLNFEPDFSSPAAIGSYDELPLWSAMFGLFLLEELPFSISGRVLDVGCGTGFPLIELAERLGPASHVDGIDVLCRRGRRSALKIRKPKKAAARDGARRPQ